MSGGTSVLHSPDELHNMMSEFQSVQKNLSMSEKERAELMEVSRPG